MLKDEKWWSRIKNLICRPWYLWSIHISIFNVPWSKTRDLCLNIYYGRPFLGNPGILNHQDVDPLILPSPCLHLAVTGVTGVTGVTVSFWRPCVSVSIWNESHILGNLVSGVQHCSTSLSAEESRKTSDGSGIESDYSWGAMCLNHSYIIVMTGWRMQQMWFHV